MCLVQSQWPLLPTGWPSSASRASPQHVLTCTCILTSLYLILISQGKETFKVFQFLLKNWAVAWSQGGPDSFHCLSHVWAIQICAFEPGQNQNGKVQHIKVLISVLMKVFSEVFSKPVESGECVFDGIASYWRVSSWLTGCVQQLCLKLNREFHSSVAEFVLFLPCLWSFSIF